MLLSGSADNIPVDAPAGRTLLSGQADPEGKNRGRHFVSKTPIAGVNRFRVRPRFSLRPYANRRTRGHQSQHRDRFHDPHGPEEDERSLARDARSRRRAPTFPRVRVIPTGGADGDRSRSTAWAARLAAPSARVSRRAAVSSCLAVQFSRNSITSPANSLGRSTQGKWPTSSITSRRAFAMPSATSRHASDQG